MISNAKKKYVHFDFGKNSLKLFILYNIYTNYLNLYTALIIKKEKSTNMIFRTKNGNLINIVRSSFKTDSDYYLHILKYCHNVDEMAYNNLYKSQTKNIENIENIITNSENIFKTNKN